MELQVGSYWVKTLLMVSQHDSSTLSKFSMSLIPDKINPQKNKLSEGRKVTKIDHGGTYYNYRECDSYPKETDSQHGDYYSTVSDHYEENIVTEHIEDDKSSSYNVVQQDNEASSSDIVQLYMDRRKRLQNYLSQLNFKSEVVQFAKDIIYKYDAKMMRENEQEGKMSPTEKLNFQNSVPFFNRVIVHQSGTWHTK